MDIDCDVPFFSNTADDTHCFQASLRMILKYFEPEKNFTWKELEKITGKKEDLWTWPMAALVWMRNNGYKVIDIEMFDYDLFVTDKDKYLFKFYGEEAGREQVKRSDINREVKFARRLIKANLVTKGIPSFKTLRDLLKEGYLLCCMINAQKLNGKKGYVGHAVVVKGIDNSNLLIHDPGFPPLENRKVSFTLFESAWAVPNKKAKNVMAFKLVS